jgi:hypothetical protein
VLLGVAVVTVVFFVIWPEYAHESMVPRLRKILRATLDLMPQFAAGSEPAKIYAGSIEITSTLAELLTVADDANLEGRSSRVDPEEVVGAAGTLRRIAHRFVEISRGRIDEPRPPLAPETEAARTALETAMRIRLEDWLTHYQGPACHGSKPALALAASHPADALREAFENFSGRIGANGFAEISGWTFDQRRTMLAEMEAWRRLTELLPELDDQLSRVPMPQQD